MEFHAFQNKTNVSELYKLLKYFYEDNKKFDTLTLGQFFGISK